MSCRRPGSWRDSCALRVRSVREDAIGPKHHTVLGHVHSIGRRNLLPLEELAAPIKPIKDVLEEEGQPRGAPGGRVSLAIEEVGQPLAHEHTAFRLELRDAAGESALQRWRRRECAFRLQGRERFGGREPGVRACPRGEHARLARAKSRRDWIRPSPTGSSARLSNGFQQRRERFASGGPVQLFVLMLIPIRAQAAVARAVLATGTGTDAVRLFEYLADAGIRLAR